MIALIIRRLSLLSLASALAASPLAAQPTLDPIADVELLSGSPLHIPLNALDPAGGALSFEAESSDPELVATHVPEGNRSLRIVVAGIGEMIFQLFEARVPRATNRIIALAESGFYNGLIFHRVVDGFVIQGGDPAGDGTGGSGVVWDDQFHVDLQHNRPGVLSMAKGFDDSNESQFFVTEVATRPLDFNHSIFGQLVVGDAVREAISNVATGANDAPETPVVMERVEVFGDIQNGLLMLEAPEGATGAVQVTVTVTDTAGITAQQTFSVNVTPDTVDSQPFLADIPVLSTRVDTPLTYQLEAIDVEGTVALYLDEEAMILNRLQVPVTSHPDLDYDVGFETGVLVVTPMNGLSGTFSISVATAVAAAAVDYQVVTIQIDP